MAHIFSPYSRPDISLQRTNGANLTLLVKSRSSLDDDDKTEFGSAFTLAHFKVDPVGTCESLHRTEGSNFYDSSFIILEPHCSLLLIRSFAVRGFAEWEYFLPISSTTILHNHIHVPSHHSFLKYFLDHNYAATN